MRPPQRAKTDFEKVRVDEWINGTIDEVQYDMEHKSTWKGEEKVGPAVRFKLKLEGYQYPKYTRWGSFSLGEKSNLYKKYVSQLVDGVTPGMAIDLDILNGLAIKTMWSEKDEYQNLEMIRPLKARVSKDAQPLAEVVDDEQKEEIPF